MYLCNLVPAPPDDEPAGQELEEHVERGGGGRDRDEEAFFEVDRGQDRPDLTSSSFSAAVSKNVDLPESG